VRRAATNAVRHIEAASDTAQPESLSFHFINASAELVLQNYSVLVSKRLQVSPEVQRMQATAKVTVRCYGGAAQDEAIQIMAEELRDQANIVIVTNDTGGILAKLASPPSK
jgi:hypothetical protein